MTWPPPPWKSSQVKRYFKWGILKVFWTPSTPVGTFSLHTDFFFWKASLNLCLIVPYLYYCCFQSSIVIHLDIFFYCYLTQERTLSQTTLLLSLVRGVIILTQTPKIQNIHLMFFFVMCVAKKFELSVAEFCGLVQMGTIELVIYIIFFTSLFLNWHYLIVLYFMSDIKHAFICFISSQ